MQVEDKRNGKSSLAEVQPAGLTYRGSGGRGGKTSGYTLRSGPVSVIAGKSYGGI